MTVSHDPDVIVKQEKVTMIPHFIYIWANVTFQDVGIYIGYYTVVQYGCTTDRPTRSALPTGLSLQSAREPRCRAADLGLSPARSP